MAENKRPNDNRTDVPAKELVLFTGSLDQGLVFPLSEIQYRIVTKSIFRDGNGPDSPRYSDKELMECTDSDRPYKSSLLSIRQAAAMLVKKSISGAAIFLDPGQPCEQCIPLTVMQTAVIVGRLGIDLENERHLSDETLSALFSKRWKPRFKKKTASRKQKQGWTKRNFMEGLLPPEKIKQALDRTIIGQEKAKLEISTAVYRQELALRYNSAYRNDEGFVPMKSGNLLICGPTGSGKTAMIRKLAEILDRPVVIFDATTLTPAGYSGRSSNDIMKELLINSGGDPERASNGIVFLDEWDKAFSAASGSTDVGHFKSIAGSFELLRMLDGCDVTLDTMTGPIIINTSNCLFIMGGAFPNLDGIIRQRTVGENEGPHHSIGFMAEQETAPKAYELPEPTPEDLKRYGIPAEVIGRIGTICRLKELDQDDLVNILLHSDQSPLEE